MDHFHYQANQLYVEKIPVLDLIKRYGTPCYLYSLATLTRHFNVMKAACGDFPHHICYAVKANDNIAILNCLARLGAGFDIVSQGELEKALKAGAKADTIIFSGVGKTVDEINRALEVGIHCFNVESKPELDRLQACAKAMDKTAPVAVRINPDVDPKTHAYISTGMRDNKFGVDIQTARQMYQYAKTLSHIKLIGIDCHIGSQITDLTPFTDALKRVLHFVDELAQDYQIELQHIDMGGGLGVPYDRNQPLPPNPEQYTKALIETLGDRELSLFLEPGRLIMGNAGILVTRIDYIKSTQDKQFAIVDAGMNDLLRPALYQAYHEIVPVLEKNIPMTAFDVVGPVCESADCFGKQRELAIEANDCLAIRTVGAYGACMSSHYNARLRPCEIMVDGDQAYVIRERETWADLYRHEAMLPGEYTARQ